MKPWRRLILTSLLLVIAGFVDVARGAPEIRDESLATEFVDGGTDYFEFAPGLMNNLGSAWTITGPAGEAITFTRTGITQTMSTPQRFSLDGDLQSGEVGIWTASGNVDGAAADGTWTLQLRGPGYESNDADTTAEFTPSPTLAIQGRGIHFGVFFFVPSTVQQTWNWHETTGTWNEPAPVSNDPIDDGPEEDPEFARFFADTPPQPMCDEMDLEPTPSDDPPTIVDEDMDGVAGSYEYTETNRHVNSDCSITESEGDTVVIDGPDPDDNDPGNPGAMCTPSDTYVPSGDPPTATDADMDGIPGSFTYTEDRYHIDEDCMTTVFPDDREQEIAGPDPDDNDPDVPFFPPPLTANTLHFTITCGASAALHTMTITGAWINAEGTTFSQHFYRDGNFAGMTDDLRTVAGTQTTTEENEGSTGEGTDSKTVSYNNAAGSSYQFKARTTAQGEALGAVLYAPDGACTPVVLPSALAFNNQVVLSVSQAQCANDPVSFSIDVDLTVAVGLNDIDLGIYSATTGALLANYDDSTMFSTQAGQVLYMADVFLPGAYMAQATADVGGIGAVDLYDSAAFNVPVGDCIWREPDLSGVYLALSLLEGNITQILDALDLVIDCGEEFNCTINADLSLLLDVFHNLTDHRNNTLEVMGMDFDGLGFDGSLLLGLWLIALIWCLRNGKAFAAGAATVGIAMVLLPGPDWIAWVGVLLFVLALWLEAFARERLYTRFLGRGT